MRRLADALANADDDLELANTFVEQRAEMIRSADVLAPRDSRAVTFSDYFLRPWKSMELNRQLALYARLIAAAREPWPDRIDRVIAVGDLPYPMEQVTAPQMLESLVWTSAAPLAMLRANRIVVAMERYKRDHNEQPPAAPDQLTPAYLTTLPHDPFSGQPPVITRTAAGYAVYSVSMNRLDDGGADLNRSWGFSFPKTYPPDLGVRIE